MNREIKFRARHKETGKWYYGSSLYTDFRTPSDYILPLSAFWQQVEEGSLDTKTVGGHTGLKDKNDKEIYEGNKIKTDKGVAFEILWSPKTARWAGRTENVWTTRVDVGHWIYKSLPYLAERGEVIGDINKI